MNLQEYHQLQAERSALEKLLAELQEGREIERIGLEARKLEIEESIAAQPIPSREQLRAHLTFRGKPIVGSQGIFAEFGAIAISAFSEAVAAIGASRAGPLGTRGILPGRDDFHLLVTGTASGSFGFQFEEAPTDDLSVYSKNSPIETAIEQVKAIMKASTGTDDELTEALADTDRRAIDAVRKFLDIMLKNEAVCALEFKGNVFRFADVEQVRQSMAHLEQGNIHESDEELIGKFLGVLPRRRTFEFCIANTEEIISGKIGKEVTEPAEINRVLEQPVTIQVHSRRVGDGRPRLILLGYHAFSSPN